MRETDRLKKDSPYDLPSTVIPMTLHGRQVKELQRSFSGQHLDERQQENTGDVYIWKEADKFTLSWLKDNDYCVTESRTFDDCIGYRCKRNGYAYTVYMYAYGIEKTAQLDGDYCAKLSENEFSENSTVLIVYLNVKRLRLNGKYEYKVCSYGGNEDSTIELWRLSDINGKNILEFYPRKEMKDRTYELMYAFNNDSLDVYECIMANDNPSFTPDEDGGTLYNTAIYRCLFDLHEEFGDMKIGYVRYNDVIYSQVPYLDGFGFFGFRVNGNNEIEHIYACPFEGGKRPPAEFIKTEKKTPDVLYNYIPDLISVVRLPPEDTQRFALKLTFENAEVKKYVLPINIKDENNEAVNYKNHVFSDEIWRSASIVKSRKAENHKYSDRGISIEFKNGYSLSAMLCYVYGTDYCEPYSINKVVYDDNDITATELWHWDVNALYEDDETGYLKVLIDGIAFNYYGKSTYATIDGKRLSSNDFDYIDDFSEGLAVACKCGRGYGYIDKNMKLVIPMQYENAGKFKDGKASVKLNDEWFYINKNGDKILSTSIMPYDSYQEVGSFNDGLCKVSTLKLDQVDLAYHSDSACIAGIWGFIDENGIEIIKPQYIYATDFFQGRAIVCKGKWTIDKKWDNDYNSGCYWTEEELWGVIDKNGKEIVPCIFDEIKTMGEDKDRVIMVHFGGWENGKWGVMNLDGNWLAPCQFDYIGYEYYDGMFTFGNSEDLDGDDVVGIYDSKQQKVLFEPQFDMVFFKDDGLIEVEVYDKRLNRTVEKLIDKQGNEKFQSVYSSIYTWENPYEVVIEENGTKKHGLIDENGKVLLPCVYENLPLNGGISYKNKCIVFEENGKCGIRDFDGNVIAPPIYHEIHDLHRPLFTARVGDKDNYTEELITPNGKVVISEHYDRLTWYKDEYVLACSEGEGSSVYKIKMS